MGSGRQGRKFVNSFVVPGYNGSQGTINTFVSLSELFLSLADFFFLRISKNLFVPQYFGVHLWAGCCASGFCCLVPSLLTVLSRFVSYGVLIWTVAADVPLIAAVCSQAQL